MRPECGSARMGYWGGARLPQRVERGRRSLLTPRAREGRVLGEPARDVDARPDSRRILIVPALSA